MFVYADNAATTKISETSIRAIMPYLDDLYGNPSSVYSHARKAREGLENSRKITAGCLNADPKEIYFTSGGSEADNQAILSAAEWGMKNNKKHIISTPFEHHAVLHVLKKLEKQGFEVTLLDVHRNGLVDPDEVKNAIRDDTCLVTIMTANNEIGTIQPIHEIGSVCHEAGVLFHTDAVQAAGHIPIDVKADHIDYLSLSGHKFHAPKGVGALYARRGVPLSSLIEGGAQERNKRAGTENTGSIAGMAAALAEACENMEKNRVYVSGMRDRLIEGLEKIPCSVLNGDRTNRLPGNVNFCFEGVEGGTLLLYLDRAGICASSGSACNSGSVDPSHVLLAIGTPWEVARGSLRLTLGELNTEEEVDYLIAQVTSAVKALREKSPVWQDIVSGRREPVLPMK